MLRIVTIPHHCTKAFELQRKQNNFSLKTSESGISKLLKIWQTATVTKSWLDKTRSLHINDALFFYHSSYHIDSTPNKVIAISIAIQSAYSFEVL
jgi:hypothetical protein